MNFKKKQVLGSAVALALSASAYADVITFDFNGAAAGGTINNAAIFDWAPGNALALGGNPLTNGETITLLYQANLSAVQDVNTGILFANGTGGNFFTAVAGFNEVATVTGTGFTATFTFPGASTTNFFKICAQPALGDNLTGAGFACSTSILTGHVIAIDSSSFSITGTTPVTFDQSPNGDQHPGVTSVTGTGASAITVMIDSVDPNYFPGLLAGGTLAFSLFNTSQVVPFQQVDPSRCFTNLTGTANCATPNGIGPVNGGLGSGPNFQFQADANQSFRIQVPEPASLALLGIGLGALGVFGRRRKHTVA